MNFTDMLFQSQGPAPVSSSNFFIFPSKECSLGTCLRYVLCKSRLLCCSIVLWSRQDVRWSDSLNPKGCAPWKHVLRRSRPLGPSLSCCQSGWDRHAKETVVSVLLGNNSQWGAGSQRVWGTRRGPEFLPWESQV